MASRRSALALAVTSALAGACATPDAPTAPGWSIADTVVAGTLVGDWRWSIAIDEPGVRRVERERWRLAPTGRRDAPIAGSYLREVEVTATDGVPFVCNQRTQYTQRARYDVRATVIGGAAVIEEVGYRTEPSPCDRGFRRRGHYLARVRRDRLLLRWHVEDPSPAATPHDGVQILQRVPHRRGLPVAPAVDPAWPGDRPRWDGAWQWRARTLDTDGRVRDEREAWELTVGERGAAATYRRTVTVRSPDGQPLACAGAPSWTHVDHYVLEGARDGEQVVLREIAVDAARHPCLDDHPRVLDSATAELAGEYIELTWRGKRRQVLHRR